MEENKDLSVQVNVELYGSLTLADGQRNVLLEVPRKFVEAVFAVNNYLKNVCGINTAYVLLYNDANAKLLLRRDEEINVSSTDTFKAVPPLLGG